MNFGPFFEQKTLYILLQETTISHHLPNGNLGENKIKLLPKIEAKDWGSNLLPKLLPKLLFFFFGF